MIICGQRGLSGGESVLNRSSRILPGVFLIPFLTDYQREQYAVFVSENAKKVPDIGQPAFLPGFISDLSLCNSSQ